MDSLLKHSYYTIFLFAFGTFLYVDFLSRGVYGIYISLLLFTILCVISCLNLSKGILFSLIFALLIIEFPRDILDVYSALQVEKSVQYNVINTVKIGPLTLFVYLLFFNTFLALIKTKRLKFNGINSLLVIGFIFIGTFSMLRILWIHGSLFYPKLLITDIKFPLFLCIGIIQGGYLMRKGKIKDLEGVLMIVPVIIGLRAVFFILNDSISNTSNLDLMTQPYLSLIVLLVLIIKGDWGIYKNLIFRILLLVSLLNPSRGFFLIAAMFISISLLWKFHKKINFSFLFIAQVFLVVITIFGSLLFFNERLFDFFMWKLNVFQEFFNEKVEASGSGKVRLIELKNVFVSLKDNYYELFFGRGFAGTYDFDHYPLKNIGTIDLKSYSQDQLDSGVYYTAHSFLTTTLLKYGIIGVIIYMLLPLRLFIFYILKKNYLLFAVFAIIFIYLYYSRIEYMLLMGMLLGSMNLNEKNV